MNKKLHLKILLLLSILLFLGYLLFTYLLINHVFFFQKIDFDTTVKLQDKLSRKFDFPFSLLSLLGLAEITSIIGICFFLIALFKRYWLTAFSLLLFPLTAVVEIWGKENVYHPAPPKFFYRGLFEDSLPIYHIRTAYSYPSGHVARSAFLISFLMVFVYLKMNKNPWALFILGTALFSMIVSRIYLGEHWTTDTIGGLLMGSSFGILSATTILIKDLKIFKKQVKVS